MAIVYQHLRNDTNQIFYIGIGKEKKRAYYFGKDKRNKIWLDITSKTDFEVSILHENITWDEACELEKYYISKYGRINKNTGTLANMTDGGDGASNVVVSDETRQKISQRHKGKKVSDETKKKISNSLKGIVFTQERNNKISQSNKGKKVSDETKKKMSNSRKGIVFSETHRQNIGKANIINNNKPPLNNKLTETDVRVARNDYNTNNFTFKELGLRYGVKTQTITNAIKGITWVNVI